MAQDGAMPHSDPRKGEHEEDIWQRRNARDIMREARRRFENSVEFVPDEPAQLPKPASAHVALASTHYSLVKRYMSPKWKLPLAVWHLWRATSHARKADSLGLQNYDQMDVVSTILAKSPRLLGGALHYARKILVEALYGVSVTARQEVMKPHTRALMLVSLGEIEMKLGDPLAAERCYKSAEQVLPEITDEQQKCRVLSSIGFFWFDYRSREDSGFGFISDALGIAHRVSKDQYEKIWSEAAKRGIDMVLLEMSAGIIHGIYTEA